MELLKQEVQTIINIQYDRIVIEKDKAKDYRDITAEELAYAAIHTKTDYRDSVQINIIDIVYRFSQNEIRRLCLVLEALLKFDSTVNFPKQNSVSKYRQPFYQDYNGVALEEFERKYLVFLIEGFIVEYAKQFVIHEENNDEDNPAELDFWERKLRSTYNVAVLGTELEDLDKYVPIYEYKDEEISYSNTLSKLKKIATIEKNKIETEKYISESQKEIEALDKEIAQHDSVIAELQKIEEEAVRVFNKHMVWYRNFSRTTSENQAKRKLEEQKLKESK
ncbi:TPA: hypothetical protein ACKTGI_002750 [Pseudomonas aeruginosa]